jgi:ketosteroid isomerase-like protein
VSQSGDLGYTYGTYLMKDGASEVRGTYVTVWRKRPDGRWKYVLDSGNQGLGEAAVDSTRKE